MKKIAIIFGANGGLGQEFVKQISKSYTEVYACIKRDNTFNLELNDRNHSCQVYKVIIDPKNEAHLEEFSYRLKQKNKSINLIINACGLLHKPGGVQPEKKIEDFNQQFFIELLEANTLITPLIAKHFLALLKRDSLSVFATLSARVGSIDDNRLGGWYSYRASKAALNQMVKTLSIEASRRIKNLAIVALHPGTTNTKLSKPFQKNIASEKLFSAEFSAKKLIHVINNLSINDNGNFLAWDGTTIKW